MNGNETGPPRITGVRDDHENGSGDQAESTVERSGVDDITCDSIAEHMNTVIAEDIAMDTDTDGDDRWDAQTVNKYDTSLTGDDGNTIVGGDNDNDRRDASDNLSSTETATEIQASMDERTEI